MSERIAKIPVIPPNFGIMVETNTNAPAVLDTPRRVTWKVGSPMCPKRSTPSDPNPSGLCMCGCGGETTIYTYTNTSLGRYRGHHAKYIHGHNAVRTLEYYRVEDRGYTTPCWMWQRNTDEKGYALMNIKRRTHRVHRLFYEQKHGPIPHGKQLDHLCRNHSCVNPDHVEPVTPAENVRRGNVARLTENDVREIRVLLKQCMPKSHIARRFNVNRYAIYAIAVGKTWRGVGEEMTNE